MRFVRALFAAGSPLSLRRTPEIGKDLPIRCLEAESIFDARVKACFPAGASRDDVMRALEGQGFARSACRDGVESLTFTRNDIVMKTIWSVRWRATSGRIDEIWGVHGVIAP
ncbi:MAG TPA: hypothetical protein VI168_05810 [Croceibacterium sp.]